MSSSFAQALDDKFLCAGSLAAVDETRIEGIRKRIRWVRKNKKISRRAWSLKAGLSQAHVGMIERGDIGDEVSSKVLDALAQAAGVSSAWLQTGQGHPFDTVVSPEDDPIPERAEAIRFARANGLPEEAIARVRDIAGIRGSRTPEKWYERIKFEVSTLPDGPEAGPEIFAAPREIASAKKKRGEKR